MTVIKDIANSIDNMIQMTVDYPTKNVDMKVPMLDVKVWINPEDGNRIYYQYYEKPTKSRFVTSKNSAMPMTKKWIL